MRIRLTDLPAINVISRIADKARNIIIIQGNCTSEIGIIVSDCGIDFRALIFIHEHVQTNGGEDENKERDSRENFAQFHQNRDQNLKQSHFNEKIRLYPPRKCDVCSSLCRRASLREDIEILLCST